MTLGAGLVLSGCGDDDTATTPAPAPPPPPPPPAPEPEPEPEPPAPEAPATPTGLHVDETTETSIEWHWNAVEGALAYAVQISMNEMFDDTDRTDHTTETHYTVTDLEPNTSVYLRVAAAAGTLEAPILSAWSTHVTGMSNMPPPPPEPTPEPMMVTFSLSDDADSPHFLIADEDNDAETAMATVNTEIMVSSSTTAIITPTFVDDANGVSVEASDNNMPFAFVDWGLLQSAVLAGEATFRIQRTTVGANQEMETIGDVVHVTCGPFECAEGMDAPVPSIENSAVCNAFTPEFTLQAGFVDNDVLVTERADDTTTSEVDETRSAADAAMYDDNDGLDIGWVSTSTAAMSVMHHFEGVAKGRNYSVAGRDAAKGTDKALAMDLGSGTATDADKDVSTSNEDYKPALLVMADGKACVEYEASATASDRGLDMPESCFRIIGDPDYLSGYSIEVEAKGSAVSWGSVEWEEDPFEDLTCDSVTFMAADQVDVCELFDEEVDYAMDEGEEWKPSVDFKRYSTGTGTEVVAENAGDGQTTTTAETDQFRAHQWKASLKTTPSGQQFKTLWFDDNLDGKLPKKGTSAFKPGAKGLNDLYDANGNTGNIKTIWKTLLDDDDDLTAGDLGKVDLVSASDDRSTADDERTIEVEECPSSAKYYRPRDGTAVDSTADPVVNWIVDNQPCAPNKDGSGTREGTSASTTKTATHPDGRADNYERVPNAAETVSGRGLSARSDNRSAISGAGDFYKCSEDDGGDDDADDNTLCDAEWSYDAEILFASGTFGCTTTHMVTVTCEWDASGEMSVGRNRAPNHFIATGDNKNIANFLKCSAN